MPQFRNFGGKRYFKSLSSITKSKDRMKKPVDDIRIRKVKILKHSAKKEANKQKLSDNDLVIVRTVIVIGSLPTYKLTKIEGSPTQFIQDKILNSNKRRKR